MKKQKGAVIQHLAEGLTDLKLLRDAMAGSGTREREKQEGGCP